VYKLFAIVSLLIVSVWPSAFATQAPIRVRCGGPNYTDSKGQLWESDSGHYNEGVANTTSAVVKGTADPDLFKAARFNLASSHQGMIYSFAVPNGSYHVNLYFAETYPSLQRAKARVFNVSMQGRPVFSNLDVFAEAGADAMLVKGSDISVTNGWVSIDFVDVVQNAEINAIEILPGNSGPALTMNFRYPDGTPVAGKLNYTISSSLLSFTGSEALSNGEVSCALIANPSAIGISMEFTINATLLDTAGHQLWNLTMGMNPSKVNLASVQGSTLTVIVQKL
jgi:hypothetical protein